MQLSIFIVLFVAALLSSAIALFIGMTRISDTAVQIATVSAAASAVFWMLVIVSSFNVETVDSGAVITRAYPSLGGVGLAGVGLAVLVIYRGTIEVLG